MSRLSNLSPQHPEILQQCGCTICLGQISPKLRRFRKIISRDPAPPVKSGLSFLRVDLDIVLLRALLFGNSVTTSMWGGRCSGFILALMSFALECTGTIYVEKYYGTQCGNSTSSNSSFEMSSISVRSFEIPNTGSRASGLPYCTCFSAQSGCSSVESGVGVVAYIAVTGSGPYSVALYTDSACTSAYSTTTGCSTTADLLKPQPIWLCELLPSAHCSLSVLFASPRSHKYHHA